MSDTVSVLGGTRSPGEVKRSQWSPSVDRVESAGSTP
jgi:hypothetical protein